MAVKHKNVETKWYEARDQVMSAVRRLDRRSFFQVMGASVAGIVANGLLPPHSFQLVEVAHAAAKTPKFTFAYVSDTHLYSPKLNDQFIRAAMRAVADVNRLDPQPDFVLFGGDLAQLGKKEELDIGKQILKDIKAPVRMMVGEHDWFLDMGEAWRSYFGPPTYSFDHKGVHFVTLMSVNEKDFWTARGLTPEQRMKIVAGLDNGAQSRFEVGDEQRKWLQSDLAKVDKKTPLIIFSHSPLYKYYRPWNFWTEDADEVQQILRPFDNVTVIHGHTHQVLSNQIGNISFHGLLSTAWPWPYAPEGLPKLTVEMSRANPFNPNDGCGGGRVDVTADGLADMVYNLWERNPVNVPASYLKSVEDGAAAGAHFQELLGRGGDMNLSKGVVCGLALAVAAAIAGQQSETIVTLCDNVTQIVIPGLRPGTKLDRDKAFHVAETFMAEWKRHNPGSNWIMAQNMAPQDGLALQVRAAGAAGEKKQSEVYSSFTARDQLIWKTELDKFVAEGNRVFHDADAFGGTIGVSCDMCHPNASNTHPETFPKYQVQMQKVALLRDMINWCIQHPAKGKPLADDDPRLRAMEAYILSERKGKMLEAGKH